MKTSLTLATLATALTLGTLAHSADPVVKVLSSAEDTATKTVLIGRNLTDNMLVTFEIEAAKSMWMKMGTKWTEHRVGKGELYHVEVKPVDPKSNTRIPNAEVAFSAVNRSNQKKVSGTLHPMWGGSGLHYAANSPLAGDGTYETTITIGVPNFGRAPADKELWIKPVSTRFHFKLTNGKIVEVSEAVAEVRK
jgi:Fe2+ transport protein